MMRKNRFNIDKVKALIFDLDGVITDTASLHAKAWKQVFDEFLDFRKCNYQPIFKNFSIEDDYYQLIDGIPRHSGIHNFLHSRNLSLPEGSPADHPGFTSINAIGNRKNDFYNIFLNTGEIEVFDDAVEKIKEWRKAGKKTAIISASKNCQTILEATGLADLFDVRVDGLDAEKLNLPGKPAPDIFLAAAGQLSSTPADTAVFEDAASGVKAALDGEFSYVVGVSRNQNDKVLRDAGAVIIIHNFNEL